MARRDRRRPRPPPGRRRRSAAAPAAIQNCSPTRSRPVTSSVTPCSTCSRAFTSRNQNAPSGSRRNSAVAAFVRPAARRRTDRHARGPAARWSRVRPGAGDSSISFWWRRWMEQSRSPSATTLPVRVAEQLDLDVARRPDLALQVDRAVAERRGGLASTRRQRGRQVRFPCHAAHPAPAAAGRRLDHQWKTDLARLPRRSPRPGRAGRPAPARMSPGRPARRPATRRPPRRQLVAERGDRLPRRSDEGDAGVLRRPGRTRPARRGIHSRDGPHRHRCATAAATSRSIRR